MPDTSSEEVGQEIELAEVQRELSAVKSNFALFQENMADVVLALDNVGWDVVGEDINAQEIPLDTIRNKAKVCRALLTINPIIKRGMAVRTAYIWGGGVEFVGLDLKSKFFKNATNQKYLFSPQAWGEMEAALGTDGNFALLVDKGGITKANPDKAKVQRIPLVQIVGTVANPENPEDIWFYKREWTTVENSKTEEAETKVEHIAYYPAIDYDAKENGTPRMIRGKRVVYTAALAVAQVNKQTGWRWGIGDITAVIFWAGAHKKFLEMCAQLVQAYSRFAFKATQPTRAGVNATATKVAQQPAYDPYSQGQSNVGDIAVMGTGANLQAIRGGGSVDFKAGSPLAGYVAAGLEIPLTELMADATDANRSSAETLNSSTTRAMKTRQELHKRFFEQIFTYLGLEDVTLKFPPIEEEAILKAIQALAAALPLNVLTAKEMRKLVVEAFDLDNPDHVPTEEELGLLLAANHSAAKEAVKVAADAEVKKAASNAPSYGDNSNREDTKGGQHAYNPDNG